MSNRGAQIHSLRRLIFSNFPLDRPTPALLYFSAAGPPGRCHRCLYANISNQATGYIYAALNGHITVFVNSVLELSDKVLPQFVYFYAKHTKAEAGSKYGYVHYFAILGISYLKWLDIQTQARFKTGSSRNFPDTWKAQVLKSGRFPDSHPPSSKRWPLTNHWYGPRHSGDV